MTIKSLIPTWQFATKQIRSSQSSESKIINLKSSIVQVHFGKVIGTIWATQKDASLTGEKLQLVQPLDAMKKKSGSPIAAVDTVGAGVGETIMFVTSSEAAIPIRDKKGIPLVPTDATIVGIVDRIDVASNTV